MEDFTADQLSQRPRITGELTEAFLFLMALVYSVQCGFCFGIWLKLTFVEGMPFIANITIIYAITLKYCF